MATLSAGLTTRRGTMKHLYVSERIGDAMSDDELLTSRAVRELLKVSPTTLWRLRRDGVLHPVHVGSPQAKRRTWRYRKSQLAEFIGGQS